MILIKNCRTQHLKSYTSAYLATRPTTRRHAKYAHAPHPLLTHAFSYLF